MKESIDVLVLVYIANTVLVLYLLHHGKVMEKSWESFGLETDKEVWKLLHRLRIYLVEAKGGIEANMIQNEESVTKKAPNSQDN